MDDTKIAAFSVKDVKIEELSFANDLKKVDNPKAGESKHIKNLREVLSYSKFLKDEIDLRELLPKEQEYKVSFTLKNTNPSFAHGLIRCILDEIDVKCLNIEPEDIDTDNEHAPSDVVISALRSIDFPQDRIFEDLKVSLDVLNSTDEIIIIRARDLDIYDGSKKIEVEEILASMSPIIKLYPFKYIKIPSITLATGKAKDDADAFRSIANFSYVPVDHNPRKISMDAEEGVSSLIHMPTEFKLSYTTYCNTLDGTYFIKEVCKNLMRRTGAYKDDLKNIKKSEKNIITYFSDLIHVESKGVYYHFHFKDDFRTITNMVSRECYLYDKNIQFCAPSIVHPSTETSVLKLRHPDPVTLLNIAFERIQNYLRIIEKAF